jgi:hypothetical protein
MNQNEINIVQPILNCPHCNEYIIIEKINCGFFRHGTLKNNGKQIDPHSSKELCDHYVKNDMIYGCGKPFLIIIIKNNFFIEICDYV